MAEGSREATHGGLQLPYLAEGTVAGRVANTNGLGLTLFAIPDVAAQLVGQAKVALANA